jgi:hypothetical protein
MRNGKKHLQQTLGSIAAIFAMLVITVAAAAQDMQSGGLAARTYVVAHSKADPAPALTVANVQVKENFKPVQVTSLTPVLSGGQGIEMAFILDDSLRGSVSLQLNDIRAFFKKLPPGVSVFVGYMQNGAVSAGTKGGFTTDSEVASKALRIPLGTPGGNASPYFCLSELVKNWPSNDRRKARVVFMVTNGVDNYTGINPMDQTSPYVDTAIHDAQRAGVLVYSLYYADSGVGGRYASYSGQSYLQKVAEETGGQAYFEGTGNPVSFQPFLKQFNEDLVRIYELRFLANKAGLQQLKVTTDVKGIKLSAPGNVFVVQPE